MTLTLAYVLALLGASPGVVALLGKTGAAVIPLLFVNGTIYEVAHGPVVLDAVWCGERIGFVGVGEVAGRQVALAGFLNNTVYVAWPSATVTSARALCFNGTLVAAVCYPQGFCSVLVIDKHGLKKAFVVRGVAGVAGVYNGSLVAVYQAGALLVPLSDGTPVAIQGFYPILALHDVILGVLGGRIAMLRGSKLLVYNASLAQLPHPPRDFSLAAFIDGKPAFIVRVDSGYGVAVCDANSCRVYEITGCKLRSVALTNENIVIVADGLCNPSLEGRGAASIVREESVRLSPVRVEVHSINPVSISENIMLREAARGVASTLALLKLRVSNAASVEAKTTEVSISSVLLNPVVLAAVAVGGVAAVIVAIVEYMLARRSSAESAHPH